MDKEKTEEILKCLIYGCYMLTDECNPVLVDGHKPEADVKAWRERALYKYRGGYEMDEMVDGALFHAVVEKMLHSIVKITGDNSVNNGAERK